MLGVDDAEVRAEAGVVEWRRRSLSSDLAEDLSVVLAAIGNRGIGRVREPQRQLVEPRLRLGQLVLRRRELVLQRRSRGDQRGPLVGRGPADLLGRRVLAG